MRKLLLALQFLTIVPIAVPGRVADDDLSGAAALFPLAGALQGLLVAALAYLFLLFFPAAIAAGLTVLVLTMIMGGFHLDGLADTFDALAVKSTGNREADIAKRLAVMKDSATGAIGVIAIVQVVLLKYLFLAELFSQFAVLTSLAMLMLLPACSKWAITAAMYHGTPARPEGLGRIFLNRAKGRNFLISTGFMLSFGVAVFLIYFRVTYGSGSAGAFILVFAALYLFCLGATRFFGKKFGGLTGDNFGAINEISEVLVLMVVTIWLRNFI